MRSVARGDGASNLRAPAGGAGGRWGSQGRRAEGPDIKTLRIGMGWGLPVYVSSFAAELPIAQRLACTARHHRRVGAPAAGCRRARAARSMVMSTSR
jgi:hypothetical protein